MCVSSQKSCSNMHLLFSADKLDGIKKMSDPFIDGRVDATIENWYTKHTPVVEVRKSRLLTEVRVQCHCLNMMFIIFRKQYHHLWNGVCRETKEIDEADNTHQLRTSLPLKGDNDEENVKECAKECKKRAGCLSFLVPYPENKYNVQEIEDPKMCQLYNVQCEKKTEDRYYNSYQMDCGGTCKKEWLDKTYVSVSL